MSARERGAKQTAYQVLVASTRDRLTADQGDLWDTGIMYSSCQNQIEYQGQPLASRQQCFWKVRVLDQRGSITRWSEAGLWTMGLLRDDDWSAHWIGGDGSKADREWPTPVYLRKHFEVASRVSRATMYATALGLYELRLNSDRVGDHVLSPEWTNYHKRVQYQVYDVTHLLRSGSNRISAALGNGWYCGGWQHWESKLRPIYGQNPCLLVQLEIEYDTGHVERIVTDASWEFSAEGPLRFAGIYEGETYDATRHLLREPAKDFAEDPKPWQAAFVVSPTVGQRVWQRSEPVRVMRHVQPVAITQPHPGAYVFDLGQNIVGWCRLRISEPRGTLITLRHNEVLNPDGSLYLENLHAGHLSTGDRQVVRYTCGGEDESYEPRFTYQGFRYVEVTGLTRPPTLAAITGCVIHTSFQPTGEFECSEPLLNRLVSNIQWSQRGNFMGVPTDCPQRDERCGYTGDANFFVNTAVYNCDVAAIFSKWMVDVCQDSQREDGGFADHAPDYGKGGSQNVGWADAGVTCIYRIYRTYGDTTVIREHYAAMKRYLQMLIDTSHGLTRGPDHVGLGDWLNLGGGASKEVIGTAYYSHCFALMSEMASAIGETTDAGLFAQRAGEIANAFSEAFIDEKGRIRDSSQTGYALAFSMGLVPPARVAAVAARFAEEVGRFGGTLATGFVGTPRLLPALHAAGLDDLAGKLLLQRKMPSWLFPVLHGATTIWERWDGWTPNGFADSAMNSFNHYAFGSVGEYLFRYVAGIRELEPGYQTIGIQPTVGHGLDWVHAAYRSIRGLIRVNWHLTTGGLRLIVELPPNTIGEVWVPCRISDDLRIDGVAVTETTAPKLVSRSESHAIIAVESGTSTFDVAQTES